MKLLDLYYKYYPQVWMVAAGVIIAFCVVLYIICILF